MRHILILTAASSLIALGACNRDTETAPAVDDAAMSADQAGSDASASASGAMGSGTSGASAAGAATTSESLEPAGSSEAGSMTTTTGPVTQTTRDNAQAEAEATNLHPKPPAN